MAESELMLLPDGRILAHHLTPEIAAWLGEVAGAMAQLPAVQPSSSPLNAPQPIVTESSSDPHQA